MRQDRPGMLHPGAVQARPRERIATGRTPRAEGRSQGARGKRSVIKSRDFISRGPIRTHQRDAEDTEKRRNISGVFVFLWLTRLGQSLHVLSARFRGTLEDSLCPGHTCRIGAGETPALQAGFPMQVQGA
jgi:hypothetical protein